MFCRDHITFTHFFKFIFLLNWNKLHDKMSKNFSTQCTAVHGVHREHGEERQLHFRFYIFLKIMKMVTNKTASLRNSVSHLLSREPLITMSK